MAIKDGKTRIQVTIPDELLEVLDAYRKRPELEAFAPTRSTIITMALQDFLASGAADATAAEAAMLAGR